MSESEETISPFISCEDPFAGMDDEGKLDQLCRIEDLDEGGKTFQPIFQDPAVSYAATWFEHEYRDHDGWQKFGDGWLRAKPIPDVRP